MSLILKRIELNNIRHHRYIVFEPETSGVTAISGPNGTGKSTIVDSIAWALYGTKPPGVSKALALVRHGVDATKEKVDASLILQVDGNLLKVVRTIINRQGAIQVEVFEKRPDEKEWTHRAGPAVSHAEPYIRKRLNMDEQGFLSAILVQQKQVDQLITASPRERAVVIEKLTGIAAITAGMNEARQRYNEVKKTLQSTDFDEKLLGKLEKELATLEAHLEKRSIALTEANKKLAELSTKSKELGDKVNEQESLQDQIESHNTLIMQAKAGIESAERELSRISSQKETKKKQLQQASAGGNLGELQKKLQQLKNNLRTKEKSSAKFDNQVRSLTEACNRGEEVLATEEVTDVTELKKKYLTYKNGIDKLNKERQETNDLIASLKADITKVRKAQCVIDSDDGICPTCLQEVADKDSALSSLREEQSGLQNSLDEAQNTAKTLTGRQEKGEQLLSHVGDCLKVLNALEANREELTFAKSELSVVESEVAALEKEVSAVEKLHLAAQRSADIQNEYDDLLQSAVEISDRVEKLRAQEISAQESLTNMGKVSTSALVSLRKKFAEANETYSQMLEARSVIREDVAVTTEKVASLRSTIESTRVEGERYSALRQNVEVSGKSVDLIEEFRENRIRNSVPVVSAYASDLLARFTDGAFTQLSLDAKFNATVTLANGATRAVGLLSGGELSSAALALRLAVNMLLTGGSSESMLILDEVLVSQDSGRAEQILGALKEVFHGQIVIISHGPYTNEISDRVVEL